MSGPQVVAFAKTRLDQQVGSGECFDLADQALKASNDKSAGDFGVITENADYVWGTKVAIGELQPGDVVQFRNYAMKMRTDTVFDDGSTSFEVRTAARPHHTAIVESVGSDGQVTVLEQNVEGKRRVMRTTLYFKASTKTETQIIKAQTAKVTTTITFSGTLWYYRSVKN